MLSCLSGVLTQQGCTLHTLYGLWKVLSSGVWQQEGVELLVWSVNTTPGGVYSAYGVRNPTRVSPPLHPLLQRYCNRVILKLTDIIYVCIMD